KPADLFLLLRQTMEPTAKQKQVELLLEDRRANPWAPLDSDERLLNLVLKNLVENSIKFTPPAGRVTVTFADEPGQFTLTVQDTGIGIPPEHLDRVFERFYQVNTARTGST